MTHDPLQDELDMSQSTRPRDSTPARPTTSERTGTSGRATRTRRRRSLVLTVIALVIVLPTLSWFYITSSGFLVRTIEPILSARSGGDVTIGHASLRGLSHLTLEDVVIHIPDVKGEAAQLAHLPEVGIDIDTAALLRGRFVAQRIEVSEDVRVRVSQNTESGLYNIGALRSPGTGGQSASVSPILFPEIELKRVTVETGEHTSAGAYQTLETIQFTGSLRPEVNPDPSRSSPTLGPEYFIFSLEELSTSLADAERVRVNARLHRTGNELSAIVRGLSFDPRRERLLPRELRDWWASVQPTGILDPVIIEVSEGGRFAIEIPMDGIDWTLPVPALDIGYPDAELENEHLTRDSLPRMTDVRGSIIVRERSVQLVGLSGVIDGVRYAVRGTFQSVGAQPGFDLTFEVNDFDLRRNLDVLAALPPNIRTTVQDNLLQLNRAGGRISATLQLSRAPGRTVSTDAPSTSTAPEILMRGSVQILDAEGEYQAFPYRLSGITGLIEFDNEEIRIASLVGTASDGGRVWAAGTIAPVGPNPEVNLDMYASDIPIDSALRRALGPQSARHIEQFFDRDAFRDLHDAGLILTPKEHLALTNEVNALRTRALAARGSEDSEALEDAEAEWQTAKARLDNAPRFQLGGRINLRSTIHRPAGAGQEVVALTRITVARPDRPIGVLYSEFPYPMWFVDGELEIGQDAFLITEDLELHGVSGGVGFASGQLERKREPTYHLIEDIRLRSDSLPLDAFLVYALPGERSAATTPPPAAVKTSGVSGAEHRSALSPPLSLAGSIVNGLRLDGKAVVDGRIYHGEESNEAEYEFDIRLANGSTRSAPFFTIPEKTDPSDGEQRADAVAESDATSDETGESFAATWKWPEGLPLRDVSGRTTITRTGMTIQSVEGRFVEDGLLDAGGEINWGGSGADIHMTFDGERMPVGAYLADLLSGIAEPEQTTALDAFLARFKPTGIMDADLVWRKRPGRDDESTIELKPHQLAFEVEGEPIYLDEFVSALTIDQSGILFKNIECTVCDQPRSADGGSDVQTGRARLSGTLVPSESITLDLIGRVQNARFNWSFVPALCDLVGAAAIADRYRSLEPSGTFSSNLRLKGSGTDSMEYSGSLHPRDIDFTWRGERFEARDVSGGITVNTGEATLHDLAGQFQDGSFLVDGRVGFDAQPDLDLAFECETEAISTRVRAALPLFVRDMLDQLGLEAERGITLREGRVQRTFPARSARESGPAQTEFSGVFDLRGASITSPFNVADLDGTVDLRVMQNASDNETRMTAHLEAERMLFEKQRIENVHATLTNQSESGRLDIPEARGDLHSGQVGARGWIKLPGSAGAGEYAVWITLASVDISGLSDALTPIEVTSTTLHDDGTNGPTSRDDQDGMLANSRGRADAHFAISGTIGDVMTRHGRGDIEIRNAELFHLPLAMWALQITSFTPPVATSFDRASIAFFLDGQHIIFERITLGSPMMSLEGHGTLAYRAGLVDLVFRPVSHLRAPVLTDLWDRLRNRLVDIRISGQFANRADQEAAAPVER